MGKIFCLMGKSSSGKDTIYKLLLRDPGLPLKPIVSCTTRPKRKGETPGVDYRFYSEKQLAELDLQRKVIELRSYQTVQGIWKYFTADDGQIKLQQQDYLMIGTLESYGKLQDYFGSDAVFPLYIYMDDGMRLKRALNRESVQQPPRYTELCRRYLADEQDFSEDKLVAAGIDNRFYNRHSRQTARDLAAFIKDCLE